MPGVYVGMWAVLVCMYKRQCERGVTAFAAAACGIV